MRTPSSGRESNGLTRPHKTAPMFPDLVRTHVPPVSDLVARVRAFPGWPAQQIRRATNPMIASSFRAAAPAPPFRAAASPSGLPLHGPHAARNVDAHAVVATAASRIAVLSCRVALPHSVACAAITCRYADKRARSSERPGQLAMNQRLQLRGHPG